MRKPIVKPSGLKRVAVAAAVHSADCAGDLLTRKELAARFKVNLRTIDNWQRDGILVPIKIGSVVRFHWPDVLQHLRGASRTCRQPAGGQQAETKH
jgi:phage terminase Nu1 subunit (DNA packaging protein)